MRRARAWFSTALAWITVSCSRAPPGANEAGATLAAASAKAPALATQPTLTIAYTSDLCGHDAPDPAAAIPGGLGRRATVVDLARVSARTVLQLDAGDFLPGPGDDPSFGSRSALEHRASRVLTAYGRLGVDVITPGERELAYGIERLRTWLKEANIAVVAANVRAPSGELLFDADQIFTRSDHRVGVFGVVDWEATAGQSSYQITDAGEAARASARSLRERGAALVVALVHTGGGLARAQAIVGPDSDVDVAVVAHGGEPAPAETRSGRTTFVFAGASMLGQIDVSWPAEAKTTAELRTRARPLDATVREHPGVSLIVAADSDPVQKDAQAFRHPPKASKGAATPQVFERWQYGSTAACEFCHAAAVAQWKTTAHAHALSTLQQDGHGSDPECLGCHLTGYLQPGGSQLLSIATTQFGDVGCESCHGPGAAHVRALNKKKTISRVVPTTVCLNCHTAERAAFDPEAARRRILGSGHGHP